MLMSGTKLVSRGVDGRIEHNGDVLAMSCHANEILGIMMHADSGNTWTAA